MDRLPLSVLRAQPAVPAIGLAGGGPKTDLKKACCKPKPSPAVLGVGDASELHYAILALVLSVLMFQQHCVFLRTAFPKVMMPCFHNLAMLLAEASSSKNSDVSGQPSSHDGDSTTCKKNNRARTKQQNDATDYLNDLFVAELGRYKHDRHAEIIQRISSWTSSAGHTIMV